MSQKPPKGDCNLCSQPLYNFNSLNTFTSCGHTLHVKCILEESTCPVCTPQNEIIMNLELYEKGLRDMIESYKKGQTLEKDPFECICGKYVTRDENCIIMCEKGPEVFLRHCNFDIECIKDRFLSLPNEWVVKEIIFHHCSAYGHFPASSIDPAPQGSACVPMHASVKSFKLVKKKFKEFKKFADHQGNKNQ